MPDNYFSFSLPSCRPAPISHRGQYRLRAILIFGLQLVKGAAISFRTAGA